METLAARIARAGALPHTDAVGWVIRLVKGVELLHRRGTAHGRLSPDCVLMQAEKYTSKGWLAEPPASEEHVGYRSPERAAGEGPSPRDDTWALAVTLYEAFSGTLPFPAEDNEELLRKIQAGAPTLEEMGVPDERLQRIIDRALALDPAKRIVEAAELRRELEGWKPDAKLEVLMPLEPLPDLATHLKAVLPDIEDVDDEAKTLMRPDIIPALRHLLNARGVTVPKAAAQPEAPARPKAPSPDAAAKAAPPDPAQAAGKAAPPAAVAQPSRISSAPPPRSSSSPPPQSGSSPTRRPPLKGLASMGLKTPVPSRPPEASLLPEDIGEAQPASAKGSGGKSADAPAAKGSGGKSADAPAAKDAGGKSADAPAAKSGEDKPASPPSGAGAKTKPASPAATASGSTPPARDLPALLDEEMAPEPSDPFAIPTDSAIARVGAPERDRRSRPNSQAPVAQKSSRRRTLVLLVLAVLAAGAVAAWLWTQLHRATAAPPEGSAALLAAALPPTATCAGAAAPGSPAPPSAGKDTTAPCPPST